MGMTERLLDSRYSIGNAIQNVFDTRPSILVLHDIDGWALDHVFSLWFKSIKSFRITRKNWTHCATNRAFRTYDAVVFGYLDIFLRFRYEPKKSIVVIHDPCELFAQSFDWKKTEPDLDRMKILRGLRAVVVISKEMQEILEQNGVESFLIPTMSRLPIFEGEIPTTLDASAVSIFKDYPRKNANLLRELKKLGQLSRRWHLELHENPQFDDDSYIQMIDQTPIYVCTSWQEGGPLPAMDVMSRGGVVVTTPVGQIQEIITDGESGFLCENSKDFERTLTRLFGDPFFLLQARINSLAAYRKFRDKKQIQKLVQSTLEEVFKKA